MTHHRFAFNIKISLYLHAVWHGAFNCLRHHIKFVSLKTLVLESSTLIKIKKNCLDNDATEKFTNFWQ